MVTSSPRNYVYLVEPSRDPALFGWQAALSGRESERADVVYIGGSNVEGYPVVNYDRTPAQALADALRAKYPTLGLGSEGGRGRIGVPNQGVSPALPTPLTFTGGTFDPASYNGVPAKHMGANHTSWTTSAAGQKVVFQLKPGETSFDIVHVATAGGSATGAYYKLNGGTAVNFSTQNSTTILRTTRVIVAPSDVGAEEVAYGGTPYSGATIEIGSNGTAPFTLTELIIYGGDENQGILVHGVGHAGYKTTDFSTAATTVAGWRESIANLSPDVIVIELGRNDAVANSASAFNTNLTALITALRSVGGPIPTCPILLAAPYDSSTALTTVDPWDWYVAEMRAVANTDPFIAFVNLGERMPKTTALGTFGLYHTDNVHGNANGKAYAMQANILAEALSFA